MTHHEHNQNEKKARWVVIGIAAFLLIVIGALLASYRPAPTITASGGSPGGSVLAADDLTYDFGTVSMANGVVTRFFKVKNPTAQAVTIQKIYTSCMCTTATLEQAGNKIGPFGMPGHGPIPTIAQTLAPNEEATVAVTFDPAAHGPAGVGPIVRQVLLETTDGGRLALEIRAQVTP